MEKEGTEELGCQQITDYLKRKCLTHRFMKPHLDSRSNFSRYQHSGATVTVDRSFVKNGKSQDARTVVLGVGGMGRKKQKSVLKEMWRKWLTEQADESLSPGRERKPGSDEAKPWTAGLPAPAGTPSTARQAHL